MSKDKEARVTLKVLGTDIGTTTGWDSFDQWNLILYSFIPNELGLKFMRIKNIEEYQCSDLIINFDSGNCRLNTVAFHPDWSVFNK